MTAPAISVIIPTLDEAANLGALLERLAGEATVHEVIVVDGGSGDETCRIAENAGVEVLTAARGRGAGRHPALPACRQPFPARRVLAADPARVGGNFRLLFDGSDAFSRWLDGFYAWTRSYGFYYGDSAVFVRRAVYDRLGGIRPIALMEDYDFVRRLERSGTTVCIDDPAMITSSRRFRGRRPAAIVWGWIKIHLLFHLGVRPETLARLYDSERRKPAGTTENPDAVQREAAPLSCQSYS